jgi:hypothetical protein
MKEARLGTAAGAHPGPRENSRDDGVAQMLDGNTHESGDPGLELSSSSSRFPNAAALLEGLAALEAEFETVLGRNPPSSPADSQ